jgi:RNA polymerase sigma-70 factor (ECF subfamily)
MEIKDNRDFTRLHNQQRDRIFAKNLKKTGDPDEADILTNDVFLKAWQAWKTYRDEGKESHWLDKIATRNLVDYRRRQNSLKAKKTGPLEDDMPDADLNAEEELLLSQNRAALILCLNELKPADQKVIIGYYFNGRKAENIAQTLNIKTKTVYSKLSKARVKLKKIFIREGFGK